MLCDQAVDILWRLIKYMDQTDTRLITRIIGYLVEPLYPPKTLLLLILFLAYGRFQHSVQR